MRNFLQAPKWHVLASAFVLMSACNNPEQQVGVRIISILVTPQGAVILAGATAQLNAVLTVDGDITKAVTWTSSDPSIAVVNSSGLVTGIKAGTAIVRAQSNADPNFNATADITVKAPVTGVAVSPATASVAVGSIQPLTATVTADQTISNLAVTWSTSNAAVATVSTAGVVTGVAAGAVTITASANAYPSATGSAAIVITPSLFGAINGNYTGKMTLTTNAATPGTLGGLPTCVGVGTEYSEAVAILLNSAGMGTATFTDTKDFPRAYSIAMSAAFSATASGTFPYFASNVPGWMSVTVTGKTANSARPPSTAPAQTPSRASSAPPDAEKSASTATSGRNPLNSRVGRACREPTQGSQRPEGRHDRQPTDRPERPHHPRRCIGPTILRGA